MPTPENLADTKELRIWVEQYVNAYGGKITVNGVEMDASQLTDEIRKNSETFTQVKEISGLTYSFLMVNNVPLAINGTDKMWREAGFENLFLTQGIKFGFTSNLDDARELKNWDKIVQNAEIFVPSGGLSPRQLVEWPTSGIDLSKLAKGTNAPWRINAGFWNNQGYDLPLNDPIISETDATKIETFMRSYIRKVLSYQPDEINIVLEPFQERNNQIVWNNSIYYKAFGENWIEKAFIIAQDELEKLKVEGKVTKDIKFYWNDWGLEKEGAKLEYTLQYVQAMQQKGIKVDGIGIQTFAPQSFYNHKIDADELIHISERIKSLELDVYYEFGEFYGFDSNTPDVFRSLTGASLQIQPSSVVIWDDLKFKNGMAPTLFGNNLEPNQHYYELLKILAGEIIQ